MQSGEPVGSEGEGEGAGSPGREECEELGTQKWSGLWEGRGHGGAGPAPAALTVCLCTAKPEQALERPLASSALLQPPESPVRWQALGEEGEPRGFTPTLLPSPPQQEMVPEFPCTFLPPTPAPISPWPPPGPATLALPRPLIVPKVERLSPPAPSGKEGLQGLGTLGVGGRGRKKGGGAISGAKIRGIGQGEPVSVCLWVCLSLPQVVSRGFLGSSVPCQALGLCVCMSLPLNPS